MALGLFRGQAQAETASLPVDQEQILAQLMSLKPKLKGLRTAEQVQFYANLFFQNKAPYIADPLGEADLGDISSRPLYRFDGFDCTTLVETVMALAISGDATEFREVINQIRYQSGTVSYFHRNHFPTMDWIPNNVRAGFVQDITATVTRSHESLTYIEKDNWYAKKGLRDLSERPQKSWARVNYVAKQDLLNEDVLREIPSGAIFNVVRPAWDLREAAGTFLDVSHQGFVVQENGQTYIVHASNGRGRDGQDDFLRVKKDLLREYVERVMLNSPTTAGMNFLIVRSF